MNIIHEDILLRAIEESDNEMLLELINDPETENCTCGKSLPVSSSQQKKWFDSLGNNPSLLRCIISKTDTPKIALGTIILSDIDYINGTAELHIKMSKELGRGKGYGFKALSAMIDYAFKELRLQCVYAQILSTNNISKKLFTKAGFDFEGTLRSRVYKNGVFNDVVVYSLLNR